MLHPKILICLRRVTFELWNLDQLQFSAFS
jgi:hypothetical protein